MLSVSGFFVTFEKRGMNMKDAKCADAEVRRYLPRVALILVAVLLFAVAVASADESLSPKPCGENATFTMTDEGVLTISGTGEIARYAFNYNLQVKEVVIEEGITGIGAGAFRSCNNLSKVTIPASVTSIGAGSFALCPSLQDVYYSGKAENWTAISIDGSENGSLMSAAIHGSEGLITERVALSGTCSYNLTWTLYEDGRLVISGNGAMADFDEVDWLIPWGHYDYITSAVLEEGITCIGSRAFSNCGNLSKVTIPDSVTRICYSAFQNCQNLTEVTLPKHVKRIARDAFAGSGLTRITIPSDVAEIGSAFSGIPSLTQITVAEDNPYFQSVNGVLLSRDGTTLICCPAGMEQYTVPDGVTAIADAAFSGCAKLTDLPLPDSVARIGQEAFSGCASLSSVRIPDRVTAIEHFTFADCTSLASVTISSKVTSIGYYAFSGCSSLTDVVFAGSEEDWARVDIMYGNDNLTEAAVHFRSEQAGPALAASGTCGEQMTWYLYGDGLLVISGEGEMTECPWNDAEKNPGMSEKIREVSIGNGVTGICSAAFYGCQNLQHAAIPDSVTAIGLSAFEDTGLTAVELPSGLTKIESGVFRNSRALTSILIPDGVAVIGQGAFQGCGSLTGITIPESVTRIEEEAFRDCGQVSYVYYTGSKEAWAAIEIGEFNESLTGARIQYNRMFAVDSGWCGNDVVWQLYNNGLLMITGTGDLYSNFLFPWYQSSAVRSVVIGEGVTDLGLPCFPGCVNLTSITIPVSVTSFWMNPVYNCPSLTDVYYSGSEEMWEAMWSEVSNPDLNGAEIHFGSSQKGMPAMILPASLNVIESEAFASIGATDVYIPVSVTSIADDAFSSGTVIYARAGSYGFDWARKHGYVTVDYTSR